MKVEDSGLLQNVEVSQNSGLSVIAYQALNIFQRIFLQYAIDIATIYTILKALIYSRYIVGRGPELADFSSSSLTARPIPDTSITDYNWEM